MASDVTPDAVTGQVVVSLDDTSSDEGTLRFLYGLVRFLRPHTIVEAGTYVGSGAAVMGLALREEGCGRLWTADPHDFKVREVLANNGLTGVVRYFQGDYEEMLTRFLLPNSVDLAFIDSGPTGEHKDAERTMRLRHFRATVPFMSPGGLIVVDDLNKRSWDGAEEIAMQAQLVLTGGRGLALYRV